MAPHIQSNTIHMLGPETALVDVSTKKFPDLAMVCDLQDILDWQESGGGKLTPSETGNGGVYIEGYSDRAKVKFHRYIMGREAWGKGVDHVNGDTMDCRKSNLRVATSKENCRNRGMSSRNTSGYKGVSWCRCGSKWEAVIRLDNVLHHLGRFQSPEMAARVYDAAAVKYFGAFSRTNEMLGTYVRKNISENKKEFHRPL